MSPSIACQRKDIALLFWFAPVGEGVAEEELEEEEEPFPPATCFEPPAPPGVAEPDDKLDELLSVELEEGDEGKDDEEFETGEEPMKTPEAGVTEPSSPSAF